MVDFEHMLHFFDVSIDGFEQVNVCWIGGYLLLVTFFVQRCTCNSVQTSTK